MRLSVPKNVCMDSNTIKNRKIEIEEYMASIGQLQEVAKKSSISLKGNKTYARRKSDEGDWIYVWNPFYLQ
jgi:hypothetical protein